MKFIEIIKDGCYRRTFNVEQIIEFAPGRKEGCTYVMNALGTSEVPVSPALFSKALMLAGNDNAPIIGIEDNSIHTGTVLKPRGNKLSTKTDEQRIISSQLDDF